MSESHLPLVTEALVRRLELAAEDFTIRRLDAARRMPGNPLGIRIERFGEVTAPARPSTPELDFVNRVTGLWPSDADRVEEIVRFYRELGLRPWFELPPSEGFEELAARLTSAGAAQIGFHAVLYGLPRTHEVATPGVVVRGVDAREIDRFSDVLLAGLDVPENVRAHEAVGFRLWPEEPGWRLYFAEIDATPAAAGVLSAHDRIGYLAIAGTLPDFRRRGCQTALVQRRLADAAESGCELVTTGATFASQSQRNLERAGLRVAYTKAVWRVQAA
jgi:GNAT superfamily N-acetyltransferase